MPVFRRLLLALLAAPWAAPARAQEVAQNPHGTLTLPCASCHTADGWRITRVPKGFKHAPNSFPLGGAHVTANCRSCHRALDFTGTPLACAACHKDIHSGEMGAECARCHSDRDFIDRSVMTRQHQLTRFLLTGSHVALDCENCHATTSQGHLQFVNTPTSCDNCHENRFLATRNPDHQAGAFPRTCTECHATTLWTPARFNHDAGRFPLTGAHRAVGCDQCHAGNRYAGTPSTCVGCHLGDYQGTSDPNHAAASFPQTCQQCHSTTSWDGGTFDHAVSRFPLTGAHRATPCDQCHAGGRYTGTPTDCYACHAADYQRPTNPNHVSASFPTSCAACHTTTAWSGATFNHSVTRFPLTGAHVSVVCTDCHKNGVFTGTPTTCYGCHSGTFTATRDPAHVAAALPTDCVQCHGTSVWTGARYLAHDAQFFPIYSGAHSGRWSGLCSTCHTNPANYGAFTCLTCHLQPQMDAKHAGRAGYSYTSTACYGCHPRGTH